MIDSLRFHNFRVLRDTRLVLGRVTVLIGPNGSGKTTALQALEGLRDPSQISPFSARSVGVSSDDPASIAIESDGKTIQTVEWGPQAVKTSNHVSDPSRLGEVQRWRNGIRVFSLNAKAIASPMSLKRSLDLNADGSGLAVVLTNLQDQHPERFEQLNQDLHRWLPEFDRVLLDTPRDGQRSFLLRTSEARHPIAAGRLSDGTLLSLAMLTLAHLPIPPTVLGLEEPDRGLHPRLLRDVQDAMFRLAAPKDFGDDRAPVQVVVTTHSPYLVDLFRDRPEDIVIAQKQGLFADFTRLSDLPNIDEILRDSHLGDAWFSGALGGVPLGT
jgi:predicted ATPase